MFFFFIEQAVLSLIKSIFTEMKYFSQNIIEPSCIGICTCMLQTINFEHILTLVIFNA